MAGRYASEGVTSLTPIALQGWQDFPVAAELRRLVGVPVLVENDATAAAIGERLYGVARGLSSFIYLFLGGGIGAGMFLDGHLYRGSRNNAGEIGHIIVVPNGLACVCGKRGCLDRYVSLGSAYEHLGIRAPEKYSVAESDDPINTAASALEIDLIEHRFSTAVNPGATKICCEGLLWKIDAKASIETAAHYDCYV
jgi:predicted NBD/HSP70 family sugar kinase